MSRPTFLQRAVHQIVTHPVAVSMFTLAALVFGWVSYQRLAVELMPDIAYPTITVRTLFEGAAPQEVEHQVSRPVEEALATLDGLVKIESRSRAGASDVLLGFAWGTDMGASVQTIRENLQTTWLPDGTERPLILRYDPSLDPFLRVALSFAPDHAPTTPEAGLYLLRDIAEREIKRDLEAMEGVAAVRVGGGLEREIHIDVREDWLAARGLRLEQVTQALAQENINIAGGSILEGDTEFLVRALNEYRSLDELREVRIRRDDGVTVPITDVARITEAHREREVVSHLGGTEAVELEIFKEADANVVSVARTVKARLLDVDGPSLPQADGRRAESIQAGLPEGVRLEILDDQAAFIEDAVRNLRDTAILGGLLAVAILFLFLRDFRATGIIGLAIPVSVVCGFAPLYLGGVTLNLMSLGGLALGVGMLVDNAVVVLESIQRWRDEGMGRVDAAVRGTSDVAAAVVASTLTTVAVFFPIAFVDGVAGELFGDLSLAVVSSLLASLVVALLVVPTLAALESDPTPVPASAPGPLDVLDGEDRPRAALDTIVVRPTEALREGLAWSRERGWRRLLVPYFVLRYAAQILLGQATVLAIGASGLAARGVGTLGAPLLRGTSGLAMRAAGTFHRVYGAFARRYEHALAWSLARTGTVLFVAALLFAGSVRAASALGLELLPEVHQGRLTVEATLPVGTPLPRTVAVIERAEAAIDALPDVAAVYSRIGSDRRADAEADEGPHSARLRIRLTDAEGDRAAHEARVITELRDTIARAAPQLEIAIARPSLFTIEQPVEVVLFGWDLDRLRTVGDDVAARMETLDALADVQSSLLPGHPEVRVRYDRDQLSRFGLDPGAVARQVREKVQGVEATRIRRGDERIELRVRLAEPDRAGLDELKRLNVNPSLTPPIPLHAVASFEEAEGPSEIRRVDQQRAAVVGANLSGLDLGGVTEALDDLLAATPLPDEITWTVAGQATEMQRSTASLTFALLLAIFLVYVIMASTFEHLLHPFVILFSVPLALAGVVVGLAIAGLPLSVVAFIGMIVLAGVVVNNAIVLVDTINRLRDEGLARLDAIRRASALRLRPILITTATTALGLFPLALGFGSGAEIQQPLAVTVIGGLLSSTLLTLVVIPAAYEVVTRPRRAHATEPDGLEATP